MKFRREIQRLQGRDDEKYLLVRKLKVVVRRNLVVREQRRNLVVRVRRWSLGVFAEEEEQVDCIGSRKIGDENLLVELGMSSGGLLMLYLDGL